MRNQGLPFVLLLMFVVAVFLGFRQRRMQRAQFREKLRKSFGAVPNKNLSRERFARLSGFLEKHERPWQVDGITWNDLDMDDVFRRMDSTLSASGEEYLWYALHSPAVGGQKPPVRREAIDYFRDPAHEGLRLDLQMILSALGGPGTYSIYDYIDALDSLGERRNGKHWLAAALPAAALVVMAVNTQMGILLLIGCLVLNMATYYREKGEIEPYLISFRYIIRQIPAAKQMAKLGCPVLDNDRLLELAKSLEALERGARWLGSSQDGNPAGLVMDYVRILFHLDLIHFNRMLHFLRDNRAAVDGLTAAIGEADASIAAAGFASGLPFVCAPVQEQGSEALVIKELYHPLLQDPVANDLTMDRPILLTGSNASGKSTFLKAAALAALFAQTIGVVPARSYTGPAFRIMSSMALRDSIQSGESYFMVEIRSLKRIMDAAGENIPVLCCIDEVLRGTNTVERIAASCQILEELAGAGIFVMAATHDRELTKLLAGSYENYHFDETCEGGDVTFSYKLKKGPAVSRNAILLLRTVGFDPEVTRRAEEMAGRFEKTGQWEEEARG